MSLRGMIGGSLKAIVRPFGLVTCAFLFVALLIWLLGPLIAVGDARPLGALAPRLVILLFLVLVWGIAGMLMRSRQNAEDRSALDAMRRKDEEKNAASKRDQVVAEARYALFADSARGALRALGGAGRFALFSDAGRALPRYLVLGAGGSGKTTILLNSGLSVHADSFRSPDDEPAHFVVSEQGLFIEIASSYLRQSAGHERTVWLRMLDFIRRRRPTQPVNGILLVIGAGDLVAVAQEATEAFGALLRQRIDEVDTRFRARPPIYVIVTKVDQLVGFEEFFDSLSTEEKDAVLGFPLWSPNQPAAPLERLTAGFAEIMGRLKERQLHRLQEEGDDRLRLRAFEFSSQFALLQTRLSWLIGALSAQSRFGTPPILRGVFFTSALQPGLSSDIFPAALAPTFALRPDSVAIKARNSALHARPLFLRSLLRHAILAEPTLAGYSRGADAVRKLRSMSLNLAIGLAIFAFAILWWLGFSDGRAYTARLFDGVRSAQTRLATVAGADTADRSFQSTLDALDSLKALADEEPPGATFGLYSTASTREAGKKAYELGVRNLLEPFVAKYVAAGLDLPPLDAATRFQLLKFYFMLGGTRPVDPAVVRLVAPGFAATMLPDVHEADASAKLTEHLVALASADLPPQPIDAALVDRARGRIAETGLAKIAYDMLVAQPDVRSLPPWRPVEHMGAAGPQTLARVSGTSLWDGIDGLYTRDGYRSALLPQSERVSNEIANDLWVMGKDLSPLDASQQALRIREGIFDLYTVDTIRRWDSLLADLTIVPPSDAGEAASLIAAITGKPSAVAELMEAIARETDFQADPSLAGSLLNKAGLADGQGLLSAVPHRVVDVAKSVTDHFAKLAAAVGSGQKQDDKAAKQTQVDAMLAAFQPLYAQLNLVATGGDVLELGTKPQDTLNDLDRMVGELPDLLRPFFQRIIIRMGAVAGINSRARLADIWNSTVAPKCGSIVSGHYPFDPKSTSDAALADFAAVFSPKGAIASFRDGYLKPFIDTTTKPWRWRSGQKIGLGLSDDVLAAFERADEVSRSYFNDAGAPALQFEVKPLALDGTANAMQLDYGSGVYTYAHGPATSAAITWPSQNAAAGASLSVTPEIDGQRSILQRQGPWALLRLLNAGRKINSGKTGPGVTDLRFSVGKRSLTIEITAPATGDPIGADLLGGYACPQLASQDAAPSNSGQSKQPVTAANGG
ncbi:type VI secretion system membrane subunit TssM [Mesorhizobium sp.]|uniref:type VI secretion system membrane subunit TssM n=1 Tax=Mesorhizobium sp. TaxID=1871066 RepID=UPI0026002072|nr:type VI secretion system membrane subunit TssM [Mesorhizobium sp.]